MEQYVISFEEIKQLLVEQKYHEEDIEELEKAFEFAKKLHAGQYRVSEEPYIIHPIEVVKILIGLRADKHTLIAGFLHDILEDTDTKPEEIQELFGDDVLNLVQGVTKLGKLQFKSTEEYVNKFRRGYSNWNWVRPKINDWIYNYFKYNAITKEKIEYLEKELNISLTYYRKKIKMIN